MFVLLLVGGDVRFDGLLLLYECSTTSTRPYGRDGWQRCCCAGCELLMCSECSGGTASRCTRSACMQANTANEHSQMLAQIPANACSDSESRKCSLVLLLVPYITLDWNFRLENNQ